MSALAHAIDLRRPRPPLDADPASDQLVVVARFVAVDGREWSAIGGGATLRDALAFARESCPADAVWRLVGWNHLHGW